MNYFQRTSIFVALMVTVFAISSCDLTEYKDRSYQGEDVLEFKPLGKTFKEPIDTSFTFMAKIQLIGEQRNGPINVTVSVVDSLTDAVQGEQFILESNGATIEANSSVAQFPIRIDLTPMETGEIVEFILQLNSGDAKVGENIGQFSGTIIAE